ncbi:plasma-membrane proton-efflux P-type ATPase [Methanoregula sp.]|uniref:plasma-membrane proton-efflux P-type ATPase n=1 Tax=Methanoregula sp. TaxID=2052170 RepID=UPI002C50C81E|nr:plasma-membrane proton-efflux P-type ATPase [Methanoregula sp.]HVP97455.1 plasma-membrane proton-efflux P-type ATPase [Methanoregula sp.]
MTDRPTSDSGTEPPASLPATGLSTAEVAGLRERYGFNDIPEEKKNPLLKFLSYFWGPIPWMIETAALLSAAISHWDDFAIIILLLVTNAVVGFFQERKAENAIELLKKQLAPNARVLRDGTWQEIPARELVPGDLVHVRLGDIVPADAVLGKGNFLLLDESALTGESLPVEKKTGDTVYSGSIARQGEMDAGVTTTGGNTFFGKTARLVQAKPPRSHFQAAVERIGNYLIILAIVLVSIIIIVSVIRSESFLETLQFALILVVAAIPVALPAVLTVTLAVGAVALAKKEAIVSRLSAIEEMAGMDILCSDKTGTITQNSISIGEIWTFSGISGQDVIIAAALASKKESNDPIDMAIFSRYDHLAPQSGTPATEVLDFVPFDPVSKFSKATVHDRSGKSFEVAKGAPQAIASLVGTDDNVTPILDTWVLDFARKGFRALGVARTDSAGTWRYLGLIGLFDPPREDSGATIVEAKKLGVNVKMVTGDHVAIAQEISAQVGLDQNILPRTALVEGDGDESRKQLESAGGFAQVLPEDKFRIVKILQEGDHIVGMTGDGVNDAPALREADAGIAVAGATDAAKSAADIVLTKPGLSVIIDAIERSREIFRRMENYAVYRIAETVRVLIFLTLCIVVLNFYPVTAIMLVVLAILNDLPIMMIAFDNAPVAGKPVRWQMNRILTLATILGVLGVVSSFILLWVAKEYYHLDAGVIQTLIFLKLAVAGHMTIYLARTGQQHFWERPLPALALFGTAEITQIVATLIAIYGVFMTPLGWFLALIVWGYALAWFLINDQIKVLLFRKIHPYS